jgi:hypothetical protein
VAGTCYTKNIASEGGGEQERKNGDILNRRSIIYSCKDPPQNKLTNSVAPAPAPGVNFDAAPAAPAPTLLYSKAKFLKRTKV